MIPFQVGIGLVLLYNCLVASVVTAMVGLLGVIAFVVVAKRRNKRYQFNAMTCRDSRMKAVNELLNYMRVIKFQAWEEHFNGRIFGFRKSEIDWARFSPPQVCLRSCRNLLYPFLRVRDETFSWDDDGQLQDLKNINLEINKGELTVIVGTVGSGKSSLLASILGEMHKNFGKIQVCGSTAYVAQTSWIQNGTIEENILFGLPMNKQKYNEVIRVCSLEKDLEMMEHGDQTEIGERSINLSGGQKQRIQLARAMYQDYDIYLLDDVFSAIDAHTSTEISSNSMQECVRGSLKGKTIILVMRDGMIVQSGKYNDLLASGMDFSALVAAHKTSMKLVEQGAVAPGENLNQQMKSPKAMSNNREANGESNPLDEPRLFGWWGIGGVIFLSMLWQASTIASDYWLAYETSEERVQEAYWSMASTLSEAYGIDYTDPEELELLIRTLMDLDAMNGKQNVSLLVECSSSPYVSTRSVPNEETNDSDQDQE
ncbi:ATP-binding cassette [Vigna unguiculata]|uniref:ABC-type xenobiotic transporter n=1 Tax=Vigna unguiculata TaxID=3917 RepID=A0A4D6LGT2_VIGUN|nr:ATP-binding cassette [Vigna unguiculata]